MNDALKASPSKSSKGTRQEAMSAFHWQGTPSIFVADPRFTVGAKTGRTSGQIATAAVIDYEQKTGVNLGSIRGISLRGNLLVEEGEHKRAKRKAGNA